MSDMYSIVEYYGRKGVDSCGYCKTNKGRSDYGMWLHYLNVTDYQNLIDRGWRRSGCYGYKSVMKDACCFLYTIRCSACNLKLSRNHKKLIKRFNRFITHGDRRKYHEKNKDAVRENTDIPIESFEQKNSFISMTESKFKKPKKETEISITGSGDVSEVGICIEPSTDCIVQRNQKKKKTIRIERAIKRVMEKGNTREEAISILKSKKRYPKEKTLEEFLNECEKPNSVHKLEIKLVQSSPLNECFEQTFETEYEVYKKYQTVIHKDTPEKCTKQQFRRFLVNSPLEPQTLEIENAPIKYFGSYHHQYWIDEKLIAVGVIDILPNCLSSVYFFYDPQYSDLILGTYGSMRELQLIRQLQKFIPSLQYYYMGFYIHSCPKMRYKARFSPSYLLCPETYTWCPISKCLDKIEKYGYCRLHENLSTKDTDETTNVQDVMVLYWGNILQYAEFRRKCKKEDINEVTEYVKSIGKKCASSMILYRG